MGNKSSNPGRGPETGPDRREEGPRSVEDVSVGCGTRGEGQAPRSELLASLQTLGDHSDHTLLPQSLHQIAEAYSVEGNYAWAVQFLQLERLYHERLLFNLATLQDDLERQDQERSGPPSLSPPQVNSVGREHIEILSHICRTHQRPTLASAKIPAGTMLKDSPASRGQCDREEEGGEEAQTAEHGEQGEEEEGQEVDDEEEEVFEENPEESPEEEVQVEWPAGVPQASVKDLVKLSHAEGISSPDGLVSILKRRRASLDGLPPPCPEDAQQNAKRKVRFSEPDDSMDHDEVGGDSCLILLFLCLVTMVISVGGTALYCAAVDTYSSICTDFSHNMDFYVVHIRQAAAGLRQWLPL